MCVRHHVGTSAVLVAEAACENVFTHTRTPTLAHTHTHACARTQTLGIGDMILVKAIAEATGRTLAQIKTDAEQLGDLGLVAQQRCALTSPLTPSRPVRKWARTIRDIRTCVGC